SSFASAAGDTASAAIKERATGKVERMSIIHLLLQKPALIRQEEPKRSLEKAGAHVNTTYPAFFGTRHSVS
ncbi:MAG: hypothetical protein ACI9XZ_002807, partial [Alphaproteobacteria bacterium]